MREVIDPRWGLPPLGSYSSRSENLPPLYVQTVQTWLQRMAAATSSDKENVGILVVGAGPTGLGAATRLQMLGNTDWLLLDAFDEAGGYVCSLLFSFVVKFVSFSFRTQTGLHRYYG